jgi:hypothetical protein
VDALVAESLMGTYAEVAAQFKADYTPGGGYRDDKRMV